MSAILRPWLHTRLLGEAVTTLARHFHGEQISHVTEKNGRLHVECRDVQHVLQVMQGSVHGENGSFQACLSDRDHSMPASISKELVQRWQIDHADQFSKNGAGTLIQILRVELVMWSSAQPAGEKALLNVLDFKILGCQGESRFGRPEALCEEDRMLSLFIAHRRWLQSRKALPDSEEWRNLKPQTTKRESWSDSEFVDLILDCLAYPVLEGDENTGKSPSKSSPASVEDSGTRDAPRKPHFASPGHQANADPGVTYDEPTTPQIYVDADGGDMNDWGKKYTRRDAMISNEQEKLLRPATGQWFPAPPGQQAPVASIPLDILQEITNGQDSRRSQQQASGDKESATQKTIYPDQGGWPSSPEPYQPASPPNQQLSSPIPTAPPRQLALPPDSDDDGPERGPDLTFPYSEESPVRSVEPRPMNPPEEVIVSLDGLCSPEKAAADSGSPSSAQIQVPVTEALPRSKRREDCELSQGSVDDPASEAKRRRKQLMQQCRQDRETTLPSGTAGPVEQKARPDQAAPGCTPGGGILVPKSSSDEPSTQPQASCASRIAATQPHGARAAADRSPQARASSPSVRKSKAAASSACRVIIRSLSKAQSTGALNLEASADISSSSRRRPATADPCATAAATSPERDSIPSTPQHRKPQPAPQVAQSQVPGTQPTPPPSSAQKSPLPPAHRRRPSPAQEPRPRADPAAAAEGGPDTFGAFCATYPRYGGDRRHFARLCHEVARLGAARALPRFAFDDYVVCHRAQYAPYLAEAAAGGEDALAYAEWYAEFAGMPEAREGVLGLEEARAWAEVWEKEYGGGGEGKKKRKGGGSEATGKVKKRRGEGASKRANIVSSVFGQFGKKA